MVDESQDKAALPPHGGWVRADDNRFVIAPRLREPRQGRLSAILGDWRIIAGLLALFATLSGTIYVFGPRLMDELELKLAYETKPSEPEDPELVARAEAVVPELFGGSYSLDDVRDYDAYFVTAMMQAIAAGEGASDLESARVLTRSVVVQSRENMSREQLLEASDVYLRWLEQAQAQGGGACREVTGHSFYDGVPTLEGEDLEAEQRLLRNLIENVYLEFGSEIHNRDLPPPPRWAEQAASKSSGLSPATIRAALGNLAHPQRCAATIHVLDALLARPKIAPATFLERV